jgi:hypothetical protein
MEAEGEVMDVLSIDGQFGCEDVIEIYYRDEYVHISIDNPWSGCTETGFGETTSITLNKDRAILLRNKLNEFLGE